MANIVINGKKLKSFTLQSRMGQWCLLSLIWFNIDLEVLAKAVRQEKEIKLVLIRKEELKLFLHTSDIIYTEDTRTSPKDV